MKAIETIYNGYRFRSRIEARWAVFFDALGVKYEYEPMAIEFKNGMRYLTDFRVKCWGLRGKIMDEPFDLYIEVVDNMTEPRARRIASFSKGRAIEGDLNDALFYGFERINPVLILGNLPSPYHSYDSSETRCYDEMNGFRLFPFNYDLIDGDFFGAYPAAYKGKFFLWGDDGSYIWNVDEVEEAYEKARREKFENNDF